MSTVSLVIPFSPPVFEQVEVFSTFTMAFDYIHRQEPNPEKGMVVKRRSDESWDLHLSDGRAFCIMSRDVDYV